MRLIPTAGRLSVTKDAPETIFVDPFSNLISLYPTIQHEFNQEYQKLESVKLKNAEYLDLKKKLINIECLFEQESGLSPEGKNSIINMIFANDDSQKNVNSNDSFTGKTNTFLGKVKSFFTGSAENHEQIVRRKYSQLPEKNFLTDLGDISRFGGDVVADHVSNVLRLASQCFESEIHKCCKKLQRQARNIQQGFLKKQIAALVAQKRGALYEEWCSEFIRRLDSIQDEQMTPGLPER